MMRIKQISIPATTLTAATLIFSTGCVVEPAPRPVQVIATPAPETEVDKPMPTAQVRQPVRVAPAPVNPPAALPDPP